MPSSSQMEREVQTGMCQRSTPTHPPTYPKVYCPGHAWAKGNHRPPRYVRLAGKATMTSGWQASVSEDLTCWGAWDTICGDKGNDTTPSSIRLGKEALKEESLGDIPWKPDVNLSLSETNTGSCSFVKDNGGGTSDGDRTSDGDTYRPFQVHRYHLQLN